MRLVLWFKPEMVIFKEYLIYMYVQEMPMTISQLEVTNIRFGKLEDNIRTPSQNIAFIYYQDERTRLNGITPHFIAECYGIPREGPYYQTDRSRAFFNMPCCHEFKNHEDDIDYTGCTRQAQGDRRLRR